MIQFISTHFPEILLTLVSAGALGFCRYALKELKNYKRLLEEQDQNQITKIISEQLTPIKRDIKNLGLELSSFQEQQSIQTEAILRSYKFKLMSVCKRYLDQGYLTTSQFDWLSEFHKVYNDLGGNDQGDEYYEKAKRLPIKEEEY